MSVFEAMTLVTAFGVLIINILAFRNKK
ncbi:putative holin-like toxin [Priestia endophytica]